MPAIVIDDRERAPVLRAQLADAYGIEIQDARLACGDYGVGPDTVIERKTFADFGQSLIDGRLFRQAYWLSECAANPILLLEGRADMAGTPGLTEAALKGAIITLAQTFRIPVLRSRDEADSAWTLHRLVVQRARIGRHSGPRHAYHARSLERRRAAMLGVLPGIGPELAARLLAAFKGIAGIAAADTTELTRVHGIGAKRAREIQRALHEAEGVYLTDVPPGI
jgi:ERCC4-type nuclease